MDDVITGLGCYTSNTPRGHLRLHDLGELLRREGLRRGLVPVTELKVGVLPGGKGTAKVDWAWRRGTHGPVVAAFEIEGRDASYKSAGFPSLRADHMKLTRLTGVRKWLLLFQVDHDLNSKDGRDGFDYAKEAARLLDGFGSHDIRVAMDVDLLDPAFRESLLDASA